MAYELIRLIYRPKLDDLWALDLVEPKSFMLFTTERQSEKMVTYSLDDLQAIWSICIMASSGRNAQSIWSGERSTLQPRIGFMFSSAITSPPVGGPASKLASVQSTLWTYIHGVEQHKVCYHSDLPPSSHSHHQEMGCQQHWFWCWVFSYLLSQLEWTESPQVCDWEVSLPKWYFWYHWDVKKF